jgi:prepilin-type processing-associated H-X9-DG protein
LLTVGAAAAAYADSHEGLMPSPEALKEMSQRLCPSLDANSALDVSIPATLEFMCVPSSDLPGSLILGIERYTINDDVANILYLDGHVVFTERATIMKTMDETRRRELRLDE